MSNKIQGLGIDNSLTTIDTTVCTSANFTLQNCNGVTTTAVADFPELQEIKKQNQMIISLATKTIKDLENRINKLEKMLNEKKL